MLTTEQDGIGILATMPKTPPKSPGAALAAIYPKRQPRRPHYLDMLMERHNVTRGKLIEDLGVDKSNLSKWLDANKPQTPGPDWALKLGRYFAPSDDPDDFVDIFTDPDLQRFQRLTRDLDADEVNRMLTSLEAGYKASKAKRA